MEAELRTWGNSLAIRIPKREAQRLGLREGDRIEVTVRRAPSRPRKAVDLSAWPVFHDAKSDVSERHDEYLYGGAE